MSQESRVRLRWRQPITDKPGPTSEPKLRPVDGQAQDTPVYRGQAGFRARPGWSGLDPIDTFAEIGRMLGLFVRRCLAGLRRTRNPLLLILVAVLGLAGFTVTTCVAADSLLAGYAFMGSIAPLMLLCFFPIGILGAALFVNALRTLSSRLR